MRIVYFQLTEHVFASHYHEQTILLDVITNQYLSLSEAATKFLSIALSQEYNVENNVYVPVNSGVFPNLNSKEIKNFNLTIQMFLNKKIIELCLNENRKNNITTASEAIGLTSVEWKPIKKAQSKIHFIELLDSVLCLLKIHFIIKIKGLQGLLAFLNNQTHNLTNINLEIINRLAYTLDKVCQFYPKKTWCLAWSSTLICLLLKRGYPCNFVIGIQTMPFYAHAWVEVENNVINDKEELKQRLAPILKLCFS